MDLKYYKYQKRIINNDLAMNEEGMYCCKNCKKKKHIEVYPVITKVDDCYYTKCTNCNFYDPYDFLGATEKSSITQWNNAQLGNVVVHEQRASYKKKKEKIDEMVD